MTTATAKVLVSAFARFVQGDIKGGAAAHAFRVETIRNAVEQAYKGNYSPITEAAALTEGKAKKARAYHAGFATFGKVGEDLKKVHYVGALNSADNKAAREEIAAKTQAATNAFFVAFDAVMAEKAEPKEKKTAAAASDDTAAAAGKAHDVAVSIDAAVTAMLAMLNTGALTGAQLDELGSAVRAAEGRALLATASEKLAA